MDGFCLAEQPDNIVGRALVSPGVKLGLGGEASDSVGVERFQKRFRSRRPSPFEVCRAAISAISNWRLLRQFATAPPDSELARQLAHRPEIWEMILTPYIAAHWKASDRLTRILDHCNTCERLGPMLVAPWNGYVIITPLPEIGPSYHLLLDQPRWLLREGQSAISVWDGRDRLFSISYCLSSEGGSLRAYVGGLQGVVGPNIMERYRLLTKRAHGLRPADLVFELFRIFCRSLGAEFVHCVSDDIRQQKSIYYSRRNAEKVIFRPYDATWLERGGTRRSDGFFAFSTHAPRRLESDIPTKKRAMYRKRYVMLDAIAERIAANVSAGPTNDQFIYFGQEDLLLRE